MVRTAGERGAVGRGKQRFLQRLVLFGAPGGSFLGGPDHRAADKQKGEQRGEDRADLLDERQEPALIVESGRRVFDLYERALVDRDDVAARGVEADRALHQAVDLGEVGLSQRLLALIERDGDRDAAQPALRRVRHRNLAADLIGAGGILVAFDAGRRGRAGRGRLWSLGGYRRRLRRLVRQRAGNADRSEERRAGKGWVSYG